MAFKLNNLFKDPKEPQKQKAGATESSRVIPINRKPPEADSDKRQIEILQKKINDKLSNQEDLKKAALIISTLINSKK